MTVRTDVADAAASASTERNQYLMITRRAAVVVATATALALAPAAAFADEGAPEPKAPKFNVTKLSILHHKKQVDVAEKDAVLKARVQVKDKAKAFNPESVRLVVVEKETGEPKDTFVVEARRVGKSKVVTNWLAKVTVPAGSVEPGATASYCIKLVKVNDADPSTLPVVETAKGLAGRDCVTVINSTPVATP